MSDLNPLLLQALTASGSGSGLSIKDLLLSQMDDTDPTTALLINYLTQQQSEAANSESSDTDAEMEPDHLLQEAEKAQAKAEEKAKAIQQLHQKIDNLYAELEELRARNDEFAAALGACYLCLGEDFACEVCGGRGKPGAFAPDKALFAQFVIPAVHRYKQEGLVHRAPAGTGALSQSRI